MDAPQYARIRAALEQQIRSGELSRGDRVPTEAELQRQYGVSRATAQRALNELSQAGLVERRRRLGTFVSGTVRQENMVKLVDPRHTGPLIPGRHELHSAGVVLAREAVVDLSLLAPDTPVVQMVRLKFDVEGEPLAVEWSAIPFSVAPHLLEADLVHLNTTTYLSESGYPVAKSRLYVDAIGLDESAALLLGCRTGIPALQQSRLSWLADGELVESSRYLVRPGAVDFYLEQEFSS
jgi:GntR family transcriptional regulator